MPQLWQDRAGKFSALKAITLILLCLPVCWIAGQFIFDQLGPRPINESVHLVGQWTLRLLLITLAVTPARRIFKWSKLVLVRRMLGVATAIYAGLHLLDYMTDLNFAPGQIAFEITTRIYLVIGMVALIGLTILGITSTDRWIRRLGKSWQKLHYLVYGIAVLGTIHYFMQSKLNVSEPIFLAGYLGWLLGYRLLDRYLPLAMVKAPWLLALYAMLAAALTMLGEAAYLNLQVHAPFERVMAANFSLSTGLRPAVVVLVTGLGIALLALIQPFARIAGEAIAGRIATLRQASRATP